MWKALMQDHPEAVGETYLEHQGVAFHFAGQLFLASLACFVHGLIPGLCVKTGSTMVKDLHQEMVTHRVRKPLPHGGYDYAI